jgi:ATP phosphoribosyltransferase
MIAESGHEPAIEQILPLGFGKCALQVQVPVSGHIQSVEALAGSRVATSFEVLGGRYFKEIDEKVQASAEGKGRPSTTIEYVGGSVEAACALGMADGIVDLVGEWDVWFRLALSPALLAKESQQHATYQNRATPCEPLVCTPSPP